MKNRLVVHIALNAKNERVGHLVEVAGRMIPFYDSVDFKNDGNKPTSFWMKDYYLAMPTISKWKSFSKEVDKAVRFQRVTLVGGAA